MCAGTQSVYASPETFHYTLDHWADGAVISNLVAAGKILAATKQALRDEHHLVYFPLAGPARLMADVLNLNQAFLTDRSKVDTPHAPAVGLKVSQ
jgi:hypothetical protein